MIVRLIEPTAGRVLLNGVDITALSPAAMREHRRLIQFIFQDPYSSLNPRMRAGAILSEPLVNFGIARGAELTERVEWLFDRVGLRRELINRLPHEFSGGQRQRSEEHTSELQSLMRRSYAVLCLKKKKHTTY